MKILSSFTHPQVDPNLYECICSAEHKGRYLGISEGNRAVLRHSIICVPTIEVNGAPKQNIFLCVRQEKDIHTGLVSK